MQERKTISNWPLWWGPLVTLCVLIAIEIISRFIFPIPNPIAFSFLAIVYAAYQGGIASGLLSAALTLGYSAWFLSVPGHLFRYQGVDDVRLFILMLTTVAMAVLVGVLRQRNDALLKEQLQRTENMRAFLRDILISVTEGKLFLCSQKSDLPQPSAPLQEEITLSRTSLSYLRHQISAAAQKRDFSSERLQDLLTAINEAAMNAIVHAQQGRARIYSSPEYVQVWIEDEGKGISMDYLHRATLERGFTTAGTLGHGFWLMLHTADRVWLFTSPTGTTLVLEQYQESPQPAWLHTGQQVA